MLPSSGRVKLNRIPLKEIRRPLLLTRRRQLIKTADLTASDPCTKQIPAEGREIEDQLISEPVWGTTEGTLEGNPLAIKSGCVQLTLADQRIHETVPAEDATIYHIEGEKGQGSSPPEHDYGGNVMLLSKRKYIKCKGRLGIGNDLEVIRKGPYTRSRHYHSKPNTRSNSRLKTTLFTRRLRFAWCHCNYSSSKSAVNRDREGARKRKRFGAMTLVKVERTTKRKPNRTSSCQARQTRKSHNLETDASCKLKDRESEGKYRVDTVDKVVLSARRLGRSPGCKREPLTAPAEVDHFPKETPPIPTEISNISRKANGHPKPNGLDHSVRSVRVVKTTCCVLCGGCDNISPWRKKLVQEGSSCASPGPDQAKIRSRTRKTNAGIIKAPKKIITWISRFPMVNLCDIARICDACTQGCGYVVPNVLQNKVVRCFKRDLNAGLRLEPSCSGGDKHGSRVHDRSSESYHSAQSAKNYCQSQTGPQQRHTSTENSINPPTSPALESGASETSTNSSASLSLGKHATNGVCWADMLDRDVAEDPRAGGDDIAAGRRGTKRKRLGDSVGDRFLSSIADLVSFSPSAPATADIGGGEEVDSGVGCSDASDTPVKIHHSHWKDGGEDNDPGESDASQKSLRLFSVMLEKDGLGTDSSDSDTEELEQSSCQRVMVYFKLQKVSCARTCMSWPFPKCSPASVTSIGVETHPVEPMYPLEGDCNDTSLNRNRDPPVSPHQKTSATTNAVTAINLHVSPHRKESNGEDGRWERNEGEHIGTEKDGERSSDKCAYSLDGPSRESASLFPGAKEPVANPLSKTAIPPVPREQKEPGLDTISGLPTPSDGSGADNQISTPSPEPASTPSPMALCTCDTTAASSLTSSTPEDVDSLSATPPSFTPSFPLNKVKLVNSACTPPTSSSSSHKHMAGKMESSLLAHEEMVTASLQSSAPDSSLILPLEEHETGEDIAKERSPLKTGQYHNQLPTNDELSVGSGADGLPISNAVQQWLETGMNVFIPQPLLSPIASPPRHSITGLLPQTQSYSDEEHSDEEEQSESKTTPGNETPQIVTELPLGSLSFSTEKVYEEDCKDIDDDEHQEDKEEGNGESQRVPSEPETKLPLGTGVPTEPHSSHSNEEDDDDDKVDGRCDNEGQSPCCERTCPSETTILSDREEEEATSEVESVESAKVEAAEDSKVKLLDEFTAYEQDILLVDVIQDDLDLFGNLPKESLLKLGPTRIGETPWTRTLPSRAGRLSGAIEKSSTTAAEFSNISLDPHIAGHIKDEENNSRSWRLQCRNIASLMHSNSWPPMDSGTNGQDLLDDNNNHVQKDSSERGDAIQTLNFLKNTLPPFMGIDRGNGHTGPWIKSQVDMTNLMRQKFNGYCWQYFSETVSCGFKVCRFQHVPIEGDERFCVETVARFSNSQNPVCLQKAGAVFTGYYQNNPMGVYFSKPVLMSLLWALLRFGFVFDIVSVLNVSLAHRILPSQEFLLALFDFVREKGLCTFVPALIQLMSKMEVAGLVLMEGLDYGRVSLEFQQTTHLYSSTPTSGNHKFSSSVPFPESLNLALVELCTKQEDWRRMGVVFRSVCQSNKVPNKLECISGRIAIALLSETKDRLSLPFATFAETVCQGESDDSLIKSFVGRIGVSLMFRYHKTQQWAKGRRVVEVLSRLKVSYSTLTGLFGNENGWSRCCLVTMATELFLLSGSVEGALNTLRDNEWFLSSHLWQCEPVDLEDRSRVLMQLIKKTSHRDTLEVLSNLPGLKEPSDSVDASRYGTLFNSHLQVCVERQALSVASATVDFMLSKTLAVDHTLLQILLNKLGKQNLWLRAREVFKHSLSTGYYPGVSAPPGSLALTVPCHLGEIELALTFEMSIALNATAILNPKEAAACISITLKRTCDCEKEYLSAGSRLLSAAGIPNPKLTIRFTAVNPSQEQVFTLDMPSARSWLRYNHLWANDVWTHSS